jgi:N-acetylmuramic acid 6-phosphate etherase
VNDDALPQTEKQNPQTAGLDRLSTADLVRLLSCEQRSAVEAVTAVSETLAMAVDEIAARMRDGGRLHYVGAGTSGRIGILDASEMPPTFGTDPSLVCAHIAGGSQAVTGAVEGAEDNADAAEREMRGHIARADAVVGISASGSAPYVLAAMKIARETGAWTLGVANSPGTPLPRMCDIGIVLSTGTEPLTGSTRLKAGTSQKVLLNTLSTAVMVRLGKVHDNLMVDLIATNSKLRQRALRLVKQLTGVEEQRARDLLDKASGRVKVAVVMARKNLDAADADAELQAHGGSLRESLR